MDENSINIAPPGGPEQRVSVSYQDTDASGNIGFKDIAAALPLSVIGGLDTTVSSLSFGALSNTLISDTLLDNAAGHASGLYEMYKNREEGYKMAGDAAALFVGVGAVTKAFRAGDYAVKGARAAGLLSSIEDAGAIGGYISSTSEAAAAATAAARTGKSAPSTLEIARAMFRARDAEFAAQGMDALERIPYRVDAIRNLYKLGAANAVGEIAAGEAASYVLLNQSPTLYPEGMTVKDWALMTTAFSGAFITGSMMRSAAVARKSAQEAGNIKRLSEATAETPIISAVGDEIETLPAKMELRDAQRKVRNAPDIDPAVRADAHTQSLEWDLRLSKQIDAIALEPTWAGGGIRISSEMNNVMREALDSSSLLGTKGFQRSEEVIGRQQQLASRAIEKLADEKTQLEKLESLTIKQSDRLRAIKNEMADINQSSIIHVNADGVHLVEGEMPRHLGVVTPTNNFIKNPDGGQWIVTAGNEQKANGAIVRANFATNIDDFARATLIDVNKASAAFSNMLRSPAFKQEVEQLGSIEITKMTGNSPAVDAVLKHIDGLPTPTDKYMFMQKLKLPEGVTTRDQLADWAIDQKTDALVSWMRSQAQKNSLRKEVNETSPYELSMRFGLKLHEQDGSASALLDALKGFAATTREKLSTTFSGIEGLKAFAAGQKTLGTIADAEGIKLAKSSIKVDFDRIGYNYSEKPVAVIRSNVVRDDMQALSMRDQMFVNQSMRDERLEKSVRAAREALDYKADDFAGAGGLIATLNETLLGKGFAQLRDYIESAAVAVNQAQANMNPIIQALTSRTYQMENIIGTPVIKGAMRPVANAMNEYTAQTMAPAVSALRELAKPERLADRYSMNSYFSAMNLKIPAKEGFDELGRVRLDTNNPITAKIWKNITGKELDPTAVYYLPDPTRLINGETVPLRVTEAAREAVGHIQHLLKDILVSKNALRYTNETKALVDRPHYIPYIHRDNQHMAIIVDHTGVPRAQVSGATLEGVEKLAAERIETMKKLDPGSEYFSTSTRDIVAYKKAHGENASDIVSWTEGASKGELASMLKVDTSNNYATAILKEIQSQYRGITVDHLKTAFKEAIDTSNYKRAVSDVSRAVEPKTGVQMLDDAFTLFQEAVTGYQTAKPGSVSARIDDVFHGGLQWMEETAAGKAAHNFMTGVGALFGRLRGRALSESDWAAAAEKLKNEHGFAPFTNAAERAAASGVYEAPKDVKEIMQKGNAVAAYAILQLGELSQGFMNATNALAMGPAQLGVMRRIKGESESLHQFRVGDYAGVHGDVVLPNEFGALVSGMKALKDPAFKEYYRQYGGLQHEEGNMLNLLSKTNDPADTARSWWSRFFDQQSGYLTAPSRVGDQWGEIYSHAIAWDYAKRTGLDLNNRLIQAYADNIARKIVTITGPEDKGNFYRTIPGIPLGLFQSFTNNYIQHLMRIVEDGNARRFMTQYAAQGMMFGMQSVPGWEQFNKTMFRNWDGTKDIDSQLQENVGRGMYDVIMHGPMWSVPKMFGGDGIGIYTRGDANIRMSLGQIATPMDLPSNQVRTKIIDGLVQSVRAAAGKDDAWEALIRSIPNRPLKGLMESFQGYATDRSGQVTFDRTRDWGAAFTRVLGLKTMTEIEAAKATYDLKDIETRHRAEKVKLRSEVMAAIRSGNPDNMDKWAEEFIRTGGRPENLSRWFNDAVVQATGVRYDRDLLKAIKKADSLNGAIALGDAMVNRGD